MLREELNIVTEAAAFTPASLLLKAEYGSAADDYRRGL